MEEKETPAVETPTEEVVEPTPEITEAPSETPVEEAPTV